MTSPAYTPRLATEKPIAIAILAMGGQGGGVLTDWIVALAESQGWVAQSTSVPGVAQRTGATIYYVEMLLPRDGKRPILSLMPTPGDVDIVLAAEYMEAGRAMLRGFVNPERTTLIASSHRSFAVVEKQVPGDGRGDPVAVDEAVGVAAKRIVSFDMQALAEKSGSVISSAMFGALAAADVLPFPRSTYEATIRKGGKSVDASLRAFSAAFDRARVGSVPESRSPEKSLPPLPEKESHPELDRLLKRVRDVFPSISQAMLFAGMKRLIDYQDIAYADEYLDRMETLHGLDLVNGGTSRNFAFTTEAAKYLAVAMAYEDVMRVADLKTRSHRFDRVRKEVGAGDNQLIYMTEYMHPRMEEVTGSLPAPIGRFLEGHPRLFGALDRLVNRGRRVRTGTIACFIPLYLLGRAKALRRGSLRHQREVAHIDHWLSIATSQLANHYGLATEVVACRRLIKGYSDTHSRGQSKFDRVLSMVPRLASLPDGADWLRRLKQAALLDEDAKALDGAIKTIESAYAP